MKKSELKELYRMMFPDYPDIVNVRQVMEMLKISRTQVYALIGERDIQAVKIGISYKIPKVSVINFVMNGKEDESDDRTDAPAGTGTEG